MATINGTFNSLIAGTLSGTVATPGAQGPQGPAGPQGAPGVGVPAAGNTGQVLQKLSATSYDTGWVTPSGGVAWGGITGTLSSQTDLYTALGTKLEKAGGYITGNIISNNNASFISYDNLYKTAILNSASVQLNNAGPGGSALTIEADGITFPGAGISKQTVAYPGIAALDALFYPLSGNPSGFLTSASLAGYATESWVTAGFYPLTGNPSSFLTASALTPYLTSATAATTFAPIAAGLPTGGTVGQVLTKNSGTNFDASFATLIPGDRYLTTSTTSNTVSNGNKTFTIGTGLSYTPTQNITISYDASHHMHGEVLTYNSGTGVLTVDINNHTGTGSYSSWVVNVGGVTPATSVAWGAITGTLGSQTDLATALNDKLEVTTASSTYYLQTNPDGFIADAPSDSQTYGRNNGAWVVAGGGGGGLPTVQIAASAINPAKITCLPSVCIPLVYPTHTDILNGIYATGFYYSNDATGNPALILSGLSNLNAVSIQSNNAMTSPPVFTGLTLLSNVQLSFNAAMTSAPSFTGCTSISNVYITSNGSMTSAPSFAGFTTLVAADVSNNYAMTSAPSFNGCTALNTGNVFANSIMTSAPDFTGCTSLQYAYVHSNGSMTSAPNFNGFTLLVHASVYNNVSMTSAPDFTGCSSLFTANVYGNAAMTSPPSFTGCTSLYTVDISSNYSMTSGPSVAGLNALSSIAAVNNSIMATAPDLTGCGSLVNINFSGCAISACSVVLDQLDANGLSGGYCDISGGSNEYINPGYYSLYSLQSKGWTVIFNSL